MSNYDILNFLQNCLAVTQFYKSTFSSLKKSDQDKNLLTKNKMMSLGRVPLDK